MPNNKSEPLPEMGVPLPGERVTVVHCLNDLRNASGPIWVSCMTNLLREHEESLKPETDSPGSEQLPRF